MSDVWTAVALVAAANFAIKASGPVLLGDRELPQPVVRIVGLLASAILTALVVVDTLSHEHDLKVDEQTIGVAAAGAALLLRAPLLAAVVLGALTAAVLRGL